MLLFYWICVCVRASESSEETLGPLQTRNVIQWNNFSVYELAPLDTVSDNCLLQLQLTSTPHGAVLFLLRRNIPPAIQPDGIQTDLADFSAWHRNKSIHYLSFSAGFILAAEKTYIAVAFESTGLPLDYILLFLSNSSALCPANCSGNGRCNQTECECKPGFFEVDCSYAPILLSLDTSIVVYLNESQTFHGYIETGGDAVSVVLKWQEGIVDILAKACGLLGNAKAEAPSEQEADFAYMSKTRELSIELPSPDTCWFLVIQNSAIFPAELKLTVSSVSSYESERIFIVVACSIGGAAVIVVWSIYVYFKLRHAASSPVIPDVYSVVKSRMLLFVEFFPAEPFSQLPDTVNKSCAVCLDSFTAKSTVRFLLCSHVYHSHCIDKWLSEHDFCCICKRDYSDLEVLRSEVEKFRLDMRCATFTCDTALPQHTDISKLRHTGEDESEFTATRID